MIRDDRFFFVDLIWIVALGAALWCLIAFATFEGFIAIEELRYIRVRVVFNGGRIRLSAPINPKEVK